MALKYEIITVQGKQLVLAPGEVELVDTLAKAQKGLDALVGDGGNEQKRIVNWRNVATIRVANFD